MTPRPSIEPRLVLPSFVLFAGGELILAILAAFPLTGSLSISLAHRPALSALAGGDWLRVLMELSIAAQSDGGSASRTVADSLGQASLLTVVLSLAAIGMHWLLYSFVCGAALAAMLGDGGGVRKSGARWFFPMIRLGLLLALAAVVLGVGAALVLFITPLPNLTKAVLWLVWMGAIASLFELARALLPARQLRSSIGALAASARLLTRRPGPVLWTWLLLAAGNGALYAIVAAISLAPGAADPMIAWAVTVFTVAGGVAYKLLRLAAQLRLAAAGE